MTLAEFNKNYRYKSDKDKFGFFEVWEIPKLQVDGLYYGDCESYCLFLKKYIIEFKAWSLYYCKLNGDGHCVLYKDGKVIDCNTRNIVTLSDYYKTYKVTIFSKYNPLTIFCKLLLGSIIDILNQCKLTLRGTYD